MGIVLLRFVQKDEQLAFQTFEEKNMRLLSAACSYSFSSSQVPALSSFRVQMLSLFFSSFVYLSFILFLIFLIHDEKSPFKLLIGYCSWKQSIYRKVGEV